MVNFHSFHNIVLRRGISLILLVTLFLLACVFVSPPAFATKIVAVVGEKAITDYDIRQRARIVAFLRGLDAKDPQMMAYIESEMVKYLVEEELKKVYVEQIQLKLPDGTMDAVINEYIEKSDKKSLKELKLELSKNDIDYEMFSGALEDEVVWSVVVHNVMMPSIKIGDDEIQQRAIIRGVDVSSESESAKIKQEIMEEKVAMNVRKLMSTLKRLKLVETY